MTGSSVLAVLGTIAKIDEPLIATFTRVSEHTEAIETVLFVEALPAFATMPLQTIIHVNTL